MKGKERSPVKKRSRGGVLEDIRERGSHPTSKKVGALSATGGGSSNNGNSSANKSGASSRRSMPGDKRDTRDPEGPNASSSRTGSGHYESYGGNGASGSGGKVHNSGVDMEASSRAGNARGGGGDHPPRPPPSNAESEYKTLKISELGNQLNDEEIEDGLFHEFKKFGDVSVKMSRFNDERVAFVNFRRPDDARAAKHARGKLVLYDRPLRIEAIYMNKRRSRSPGSKDTFAAGHRHLPPQRPLSPTGLGYRDYRLQQLALGRLPPPPPPPHLRDLERDREFSLYDARTRPPFIPERAVYREEDLIYPEDDQRANRTLFLGNLDVNVTDSDLRRAFDRFGVITEVDIKRTQHGQNCTYGFLKFENLDMAHRAKLSMSGKLVGRNPIKIGYGKPTPTTRLWVGGLGPWVPLAALAREFDRFGTIRSVDYRKGDAWAYIQYESLDAAQAACTNMRGFPLGGPDRRLRVDFAEVEHRYQQQQPYMQLLPPARFDIVPEPFTRRLTPESIRLRERSPPGHLRYRERDPYSSADWPGLGVHDRVRGAGFDPLDHLDRRESWSVEQQRDLQSRDQGRKRRPLDDGRRLDRSPDNSDYARRRPVNSLERSPGGSSRDGGRYSDPERPLRSGRNSPARGHQNNNLDNGPGEKRRRTLSPVGPERDHKRKTSDSIKSPVKKEERSEHPSSSSKSNQHSKQEAGGQKLGQAWQGVLLLKNSSFPTSMHLLQGDMAVAAGLLADSSAGSSKVSQLKITQRLRMDRPKLDEVSRRLKSAGPGGYSILIAVPGKAEDGSQGVGSSTERPLKNLVSYLKQKEAAGVVSLPVGGSRDKEHAGVLHAFPPCDFSLQFLDASSKAFAKSEEDYLVMVIIRGAS